LEYGCQQHFGTRIIDVVMQTMCKEIEEQKLKINDHGYLKENINTGKIRKKKRAII
jgi:citrate lyase gamma subunit